MYSSSSEDNNVNRINVRARNPHQRIVDDNERANRLSDAGLSDDGSTDDRFRKLRYEDPDLLYEYDEFYKTTKSLLVLFQIMGVMPIERSGKGHTTFRLGSLRVFKALKNCNFFQLVLGYDDLRLRLVLVRNGLRHSGFS